MCGIVGYVSLTPKRQSHDRKLALQTLLLADVVRGSCGTGIYAADLRLGKFLEFKKALASPDFLQHRVYEAFAKNQDDYEIVIGHNRAATYGSAKDENCHPFVNKHIGLVHNGSVSNYHNISSPQFSHQVDSAHIADGMANNGEMETLETMKGPAVLVWHNAENKTFNIARNNNRDIWYISGQDNDLYFASEYLMLDWVLDRVGIKTKGKYMRPNDHTWFTWDVSGNTLADPTWREFEVKKPEARSYPTYGENQWKGHNGGRSFWEDEEYEAIGIAQFEEYKIKLTGFSAYDSYGKRNDNKADENPNGYMIGMISGIEAASKAEVRVHGVSLNEYSKFMERGFVAAKVQSIWHEKGKSIVIARHPREITELEVPVRLHGPSGRLVSKERAEELLKSGCAWCGDPIPLIEFNNVKWLQNLGMNETFALCPKCKTCDEVVEEIAYYVGSLK